MHDNAIASLLLAENPSAAVLVGSQAFRLKSALQGAQQLPDDKQVVSSPPVMCIDSLADLAEHVRQARASGENPFDEMVMCLFLPTGVGSVHNWLGTACRAAPKLVLVEHAKSQTSDNLLEDEQFFAHGFRKIDSLDRSHAPQSHWYGYSLRDYKQAPDWLNARFWAHPERFGILD